MQQPNTNEVTYLSGDLDRFLSTFFNHRGWRIELGLDRDNNTVELIVHLSNRKLSRDDRFLSLVEQFMQMRSSRVQQRTGFSLQSRLFSADGDEITSLLHRRGQLYLTDPVRASHMRRRLTRLCLWRRFLFRILPSTLLWFATLFVVVDVIGLPFALAIILSSAALLLQSFILARMQRQDEPREA